MARARTNRKSAAPTVGSLLGEYVRKARQAQGLSQRALADQSGLSRSYVCDIERGRGAEPSLATLDKLSVALGASRSELMQAAGLIDRALVPRESEDERRLLSLYRDLGDASQQQILRYARFLHHEEHNWQQASFVDESEESGAKSSPRNNGQSLPLFEMEA
ncbi:MAG TPA: helix-turn-helix transcriptional regulator [Thermomicrobiales bacterium]|jgi:transcriptional regulator with XRE-family HTH domain|nr:helix-turn-helix transcriptional regulator [Thermomicrobiales bacterium]